jgi:hypothetical protein
LKAQLIADQGGEGEISAAKMILIDAIVTATLKHKVVHSYLATIERPWCDRRSNKVWRVVLDAAQLERHLVNLLGQLGLERVPEPVESLEDYIARKTAEKAIATNGDAARSLLDAATATQPGEVVPEASPRRSRGSQRAWLDLDRSSLLPGYVAQRACACTCLQVSQAEPTDPYSRPPR